LTVLIGRQHLCEEGTQLDLTPRAARFDVSENSLEIACSSCEVGPDLFKALAVQSTDCTFSATVKFQR